MGAESTSKIDVEGRFAPATVARGSTARWIPAIGSPTSGSFDGWLRATYRRRYPGRAVAMLAWAAAIALVGQGIRVAHADERVPRVPRAVYDRFMPPPPSVPPGPPPPVVGPRVFLNADSGAAILQQLDPALRWRNVCSTPCGMVLDASAAFRVGGGDTRPSGAFLLPRSTGDVTIKAAVGSKAKHYTGLGLMIGGGVAMAYGGAYWAFFRDLGRVANDPQFKDTSRFYETVGLVALVVGVTLVIAGIPLWFSKTTVEVR